MNILTVLDGEPWSRHQIVGSLGDLGHNVQTFVYGAAAGEFYRRAREAERRKKNDALVEMARTLAKQSRLDLIFCYVYDDFLLPEHARALADVGVPVVNLNVDMANQWYRQIRTAKYFTYMLCAQRAHMASCSRPMARARSIFRWRRAHSLHRSRTTPSARAAPVSFLGTPTPYRRAMLSRLHEAGLPLAIYGRYWRDNKTVVPDSGLEKTLSDIRNYAFARVRHEGFAGVAAPIRARLHRSPGVESVDDVLGNLAHGAIDDAAMTSLFRNSEVNIGFTRMSGLECRPVPREPGEAARFRSAARRRILISSKKRSDHAELYDIGREIVTWTSTEELVDKTRYYLAHPSERERIAAAGQQRAARDHTWEKRFTGLFERLGLKMNMAITRTASVESIVVVTPWFPNRPGEQNAAYIFDSAAALAQYRRQGVRARVPPVRAARACALCAGMDAWRDRCREFRRATEQGRGRAIPRRFRAVSLGRSRTRSSVAVWRVRSAGLSEKRMQKSFTPRPKAWRPSR